MLNIIEKNRLFFGLYIISFFAVFFYELNKPLLDATLYFGEHRTEFGDVFFAYWTLLGEAYPYLFVALFFYFYQKDKQNTAKIVITGIIILIVSGALKEVFDFPRPINFLNDIHLTTTFNFVKGIDIHTGTTSFPSGHTASAFALWTLTAFQFSHLKTVQVGLFLTAFLVGVSRVYLTQHFPQDALFGSAIGIAIALVVEYYLAQERVNFDIN